MRPARTEQFLVIFIFELYRIPKWRQSERAHSLGQPTYHIEIVKNQPLGLPNRESTPR